MQLRPRSSSFQSTQCEECDVAVAAVFCETCRAAFCQPCIDSSHASKVLSRHVRKPIVPQQSNSCKMVCPDHGLEVDFLCADCDLGTDNRTLLRCAACSECKRSGPHKGHRLQPLSVVSA